ncbi:MAG TPA: phage holin family protein [Rhodocyclaceae bacterium]|nr:phage holin family protein [Rhodocyclaceae bacterium]
MARLLLVWLLNAVALIVVANLLPGIEIASLSAALLAAVLLGLINAFLRPLLVLLTLPATLLTLGLFVLVINACLFWLGGSLIEGFKVSGFWPGLFGALLYSLVSWAFASVLLGEKRK